MNGFSNASNAADTSDRWIHEGWATYLESLYVEYHHSKVDGLEYLNDYKRKARNRLPIIAQCGIDDIPLAPFWRAASIIFFAFRALMAMGFSHKTCFPATKEQWCC